MKAEYRCLGIVKSYDVVCCLRREYRARPSQTLQVVIGEVDGAVYCWDRRQPLFDRFDPGLAACDWRGSPISARTEIS